MHCQHRWQRRRGLGRPAVLHNRVDRTPFSTPTRAQNIGALQITRVGSRRVIQAGSAFMLVFSCVGAAAAGGEGGKAGEAACMLCTDSTPRPPSITPHRAYTPGAARARRQVWRPVCFPSRPHGQRAVLRDVWADRSGRPGADEPHAPAQVRGLSDAGLVARAGNVAAIGGLLSACAAAMWRSFCESGKGSHTHACDLLCNAAGSLAARATSLSWDSRCTWALVCHTTSRVTHVRPCVTC